MFRKFHLEEIIPNKTESVVINWYSQIPEKLNWFLQLIVDNWFSNLRFITNHMIQLVPTGVFVCVCVSAWNVRIKQTWTSPFTNFETGDNCAHGGLELRWINWSQVFFFFHHLCLLTDFLGPKTNVVHHTHARHISFKTLKECLWITNNSGGKYSDSGSVA